MESGKHNDTPITFEEALDKTGNGIYNYFLLAACSLILLAIGVDMFGFSLVVTAACDLKLTVFERGILTSVPFVGIIMTSFIWGYVSDTKGRKFTLVVPLMAAFVLSCISSLAPHWIFLGLAKFLSVCFSCAANSATYTLVGESCIQRVRSKYMVLMTCLIILSPAVAGKDFDKKLHKMSIINTKKEIVCANDKTGHTYDEAMELTGHGRYNYLLLVACSTITLAVALDMFGFSIIVAAARCDLHLGFAETGVLASAPFTGVLFACPWGYYADTRGRRRALLYSTIVGFIFAAISSFSPSWQLMMAFKVIACSFSNAAYTLTMTLLGECTGIRHRSSFLFIMNSINLIAECFSFGLAYFLLPAKFSLYIPGLDIQYNSWRLFTFMLALPLGIGSLLLAYLHESPKFLASRGDSKKAMEFLRSIYEWNGGNKYEYPVQHIIISEDDAVIEKVSFWQSVVQQTVPIFKPPLLWRTLLLFYLFAICSSTNNSFVMWYPTIVNYFYNSVSGGGWNTDHTFCERVFANNSIILSSSEFDNASEVCDASISTFTVLSGIFYGAFFCIMTLLVSVVAKYRRTVLIFWLVVSGVSMTLVDLRQPAASLTFFIIFQTSTIGVPSLASYCVDLYPTAYRGMVTSLGMMTARIFSLGGINLVGAVIKSHCSLTFYSWSIFVFSGIGLCFLLPSDIFFYK